MNQKNQYIGTIRIVLINEILLLAKHSFQKFWFSDAVVLPLCLSSSLQQAYVFVENLILYQMNQKKRYIGTIKIVLINEILLLVKNFFKIFSF